MTGPICQHCGASWADSNLRVTDVEVADDDGDLAPYATSCIAEIVCHSCGKDMVRQRRIDLS